MQSAPSILQALAAAPACPPLVQNSLTRTKTNGANRIQV